MNSRLRDLIADLVRKGILTPQRAKDLIEALNEDSNGRKLEQIRRWLEGSDT